MSLRDGRLLFDIAIRLQIFAEGVKVTEALYFDIVLAQVLVEFKKLLSRLNFTTLDSMTKLELNKLIVTLRRTQATMFSQHLDKVLNRLQAFMQASLKVKRISYAWAAMAAEAGTEDIEIPTDEEASAYIEQQNKRNQFIALFGLAAIKKGSTSLWPSILNEPMPSTGTLIEPFLSSLAASTQVNLENAIRKGYANTLTPQQTIAEGEAVVSRSQSQAVAVIATTMQHITSVVSAAITSGLHGRYRWLSVIDGSTTDICISRNNRIYEYGRGPLPPAHIRCRSSIQPVTGDEPDSETFYAFLRRQSPFVQNFALGNAGGELLRTEKLKAKDVTRLQNPKPLTIEEYGNFAKRVIEG